MPRRAQTRQLWHLLEPIHAVTYFAPEVVAAYRAVGLKGFWMGYFAGRVAPMGPVGPEVAAAVVCNFEPSMVARALPAAWSLAPPEAVLAARAAAVEAVLTPLLGGADEVAEAAELAETAVAGGNVAGRALFAGYTTLPRARTPVGRLWWAATLLREHRGDGHVAATLAQGLDGLDSHLLFVGTGQVQRATLQPNRGWDDATWDARTAVLEARGLLADGRLTPVGADLRQAIEDTTDDLAAEPWAHLGEPGTARLAELLAPLAARVLAAGHMPFPNPVGLPAPV